MKKIILIAVIGVTAFLLYQTYGNKSQMDNEKRGVFISYIEFMNYFDNKTEEEIKKEVDRMIEETNAFHLNRIYLQVRPFSDSIYPSKIFPFSHTVSGKQGKGLSFDLLDYFIKKAHQVNIELYAWINPYRISNYTDTSFLSRDNPAYLWLDTNHVKTIPDKGIYYNPASSEVMDLIVSGVEEIVTNYEIDGILLDDYFYPDDTIDLENYEKVKNTISITDFRLSKVNELVKRIYDTVHKIKPNTQFGISPDGNITNNYDMHYADVKKWLKEDGYIDFIMPQIYYGFRHETKPFIETINEWKRLIQNDVELQVALALYKSGKEDQYAKSGSREWIEYNDIIKKQILVARNMNIYQGFSIFRYQYLIDDSGNKNLEQEIKQLRQIVS